MKFKRGDLVLVRHGAALGYLGTSAFTLVPSIIIDVTSSRAAPNFFKVSVYNIPGCRIDTAYNTHIKLLVSYGDPKVGESGSKWDKVKP